MDDAGVETEGWDTSMAVDDASIETQGRDTSMAMDDVATESGQDISGEKLIKASQIISPTENNSITFNRCNYGSLGLTGREGGRHHHIVHRKIPVTGSFLLMKLEQDYSTLPLITRLLAMVYQAK